MKNSIVKLFGISVLLTTLITGCSSSDSTPSNNPFVLDANNFKGTITEGEVVLTSSTVYHLTGKLQVNSGATLTIPAGTVIEGMGTSSYIAVAQGGKINVNGTAVDPVVMTSGLSVKNSGDWGGLVICGKAPINRTSGGSGTASSEIGGLTYGGTVASDNSGSIRYLRVEYAGSEFNGKKSDGVSLFGVGSGTTFEYVEAFRGADDGFGFFGGTLNTSYLVAIGNQDDQFDWAEGFAGTHSNWYAKIAYGKGNRGIEGDNYELGFGNTPISNPTITNITLVGPGSGADPIIYSDNQAFKLRTGTKGQFSNVVLSGWKQGFNVEDDATISFVGTLLKATAVNFIDVATQSKGTTTAGADANVSAVFTESALATGAGNGENAPAWSTGWTAGF